jgi:hypothetical protein
MRTCPSRRLVLPYAAPMLGLGLDDAALVSGVCRQGAPIYVVCAISARAAQLHCCVAASSGAVGGTGARNGGDGDKARQTRQARRQAQCRRGVMARKRMEIGGPAKGVCTRWRWSRNVRLVAVAKACTLGKRGGASQPFSTQQHC